MIIQAPTSGFSYRQLEGKTTFIDLLLEFLEIPYLSLCNRIHMLINILHKTTILSVFLRHFDNKWLLFMKFYFQHFILDSKFHILLGQHSDIMLRTKEHTYYHRKSNANKLGVTTSTTTSSCFIVIIYLNLFCITYIWNNICK